MYLTVKIINITAWMQYLHFAIACLFLTPLFSPQSTAIGLHPNRGLSMIWYGSQANLDSRNNIVENGQIVFMWRVFEPTEGNYNFAELDSQLAAIEARRMKTTIQINGNYHPDYIFKTVPYLNAKAYEGQSDHTIGYGPPMYWHPLYKEKFENLIRALAIHLKKSPYKSSILGIRHSPNAVGTEHFRIKADDLNQTNWTLPQGATWGDQWPWTKEIGNNYRTWTIDMFIEHFDPLNNIPMFMRISAISEAYASDKHKLMAANGQLMLFETSSEPQPRTGKELQYQAYVDYCKSGKTWGFTESWSKAVTNDTGWGWTKTATPISLAQFNYWALLLDLHCGTSFPARRPQDIDVPDYRSEYEFTAMYAGAHHDPTTSPGAWIAFREGDFLAGDYTFLMTRQSDKTVPLYNIDDSRYGLWARKLNDGTSIAIRLDSTFATSLIGYNNTKLRVRYKDNSLGYFTVSAYGKTFTEQKNNSGKWKLAEFSIDVLSNNPEIIIKTIDGDLTIHMVELLRGEKDSTNTISDKKKPLDQIIITPTWVNIPNALAENSTIKMITLDGKLVYSNIIPAGFSGIFKLPILISSAYIVQITNSTSTNYKVILQ